MADNSYIFRDTQNMDWQDDPGIPGFKEKVLYEDKEREATARLWYVPPGFGADIHHGEPHRHYHRSVIERSYVLYGDFPHWEFSTVDDLEGELVIFRRGLVMDRPVGSLHGLLPEPASLTGAMLVYWNSGPGTSVLDQTYSHESIDVPFDPQAKVEINQFNAARLFMADDIPWQAHPSIPQWKYRPLADASHDSGAVSMVHIPTDWSSKNGEEIFGDVNAASWLYVINGDLQLTNADGSQNVNMKEGSFLRWQGPDKLGFGEGAATETGCVALCVGQPIVGQTV